jgi:hypothetical protein
MSEDPNKALKDRLGAVLGELTDTLTTAQEVAQDAERGIAQSEIDTVGDSTVSAPPVAKKPDSV